MTGFVLAFLAGVFQATNDILNKKALGNINAAVVSWCLAFFSLPFLAIALCFDTLPARLDWQFWCVLLIDGVLEVLGLFLYIRAIKLSDVSRVVPMMAFTPLFLLLTSPLMVHEFPSALGFCGVLLVIAGSYVINLKSIIHGWLGPFRALFTDPGTRSMLLAAFVWSLTSNLVKVGIWHSTALSWSISIYAVIALFFYPIAQKSTRGHLFVEVRQNFRTLFVLGFISALICIAHMYATKLILVVYVIAIKRSSIVITTIFGRALLKESEFPQRLAGSLVMLGGIALIVLQ